MKEHIIQIGIGIDDDAIVKSVKEGAFSQICEDIIGEIME